MPFVYIIEKTENGGHKLQSSKPIFHLDQDLAFFLSWNSDIKVVMEKNSCRKKMECEIFIEVKS